MFDRSKREVVNATIAKVEWSNPHIFIWAYVLAASGTYQLYAFQGASINALSQLGWTESSFKPGEHVTVEYFPLKDGRPGGAFARATHADGTITRGDGVPGGSAKVNSGAGAVPAAP